jgi:DNA-binding XRE family transcriptional regulator
MFIDAPITDRLRSWLARGNQQAMLIWGRDHSMARRNVDNLPPNEADPNDLVAIFGANLKAARLKQGLTQAQLAERAGLLQQYVSLVETGKQNVTLTTAQALARVVQQNVSTLLQGTARTRRRR